MSTAEIIASTSLIVTVLTFVTTQLQLRQRATTGTVDELRQHLHECEHDRKLLREERVELMQKIIENTTRGGART